MNSRAFGSSLDYAEIEASARETLPPEYHKLIAEGKYKDTPDFKYSSDCKSSH